MDETGARGEAVEIVLDILQHLMLDPRGVSEGMPEMAGRQGAVYLIGDDRDYAPEEESDEREDYQVVNKDADDPRQAEVVLEVINAGTHGGGGDHSQEYQGDDYLDLPESKG